MTCPHWTGATCAILRDMAGITDLAGPGNPNHPCPACQTEWTSAAPIADNLTPTMQRLLVIVNQPPMEPSWDPSMPSRGLGDTLASILSAVGIRKRHGCGCGRKIAWLNRMVPYSTTSRR